MKNIFILFLSIVILSLFGCSTKEEGNVEMGSIDKATIDKTIKSLINENGEKAKFRIEKGVNQAASFWTKEDGTSEEFVQFCSDNFIGDEAKLDQVFERLNSNFEVLAGHLNKITLDLNIPLHLDIGETLPIDYIFGAYNPAAHLTNDFFKNKLAFFVLLNFPHYTLEEKNKLGENWSPKEWGYARVGDIFTSRIPAQYLQKVSEAMSKADAYISEYNIYVGNLIDKDGNTYFPKDMKLISHWNLRDELKSQYSKENGLPQQKLIYEVMLRIINQDIPQEKIGRASCRERA